MDGEQDAAQTEGQQQEQQGDTPQPQGAKTPRRMSRKR